MKKLWSVLLSVLILLNTTIVLAQQSAFLAEVEASGFDMSLIDEDKVFIAEITNWIMLKKGEETGRFYLGMPGKEDFYTAIFEKNRYVGTEKNFISTDALKYYNEAQAMEYASENGLSEPEKICAVVIEERVHLYAYKFMSSGKNYIIPYRFADYSIFNVTEDESCNFVIGKAYTVDEVVAICEKEQALYDEYRSQQKNDRPTVTIDEDGNETIKVSGVALSDVKKEILANINLMEDGSYAEIKTESDSDPTKHIYEAGASKKELTLFIENLLDEITVQTVGNEKTKNDRVSSFKLKLKHTENGKKEIYTADISVSGNTACVSAGANTLEFCVRNPKALIEQMETAGKTALSSFENEKEMPTVRGTLDGLEKTDIIEFECVCDGTEILSEVAEKGSAIKGIFEKYKINKYKSVYILTLSGNIGTVVLHNEVQSSLSGEDEYFSNNIPVAFLNSMRYENGQFLEYSSRGAGFTNFKMVFDADGIKEAYLNDILCDSAVHKSLSDDKKLEEEFVEKEKEAVIKDAKECADNLYKMGLFKGTDKGFELEKSLTREESATVLVRLLGEEEKITEKEYNEIFDDVSKERWSFASVMYCYENGITKGTGTNTFSPTAQIDAQQFTALLLRLLGYSETDPENALEKSVEYKLLDSETAEKLENAEIFTRSDMVQIVYSSLHTQMKNENVFAEFLADTGVITRQELDIIK